METQSLRQKAQTMQQVKALTPFGSTEDFETAQRIGKLINFSSLVEQDGSPQQRIANAVVLQDLARTTNISIFTLAKSVYIVHGKVGFSAEFYRGICNNSGEFQHKMRFRFNEDRTSCVAYTRDSFDGELLETPPFTIKQARKEGLLSKSGSKWGTRPDMMLIHRVSFMFATMYASHLYLGFEKFVQGVADEDNSLIVGDSPEYIDVGVE